MNDDPPQSRFYGRERYREYADSSASDGRHSMLASIIALAVFFGVGALSFWQATEPSRARDQLEIGIAAITDIDTYLDETHPDLVDAAQEGDTAQVTLPAYPLEVSLTPEEVLQLDQVQLREVILDRSAEIVYAGGLDAFDQTGNQSVGFLSSEWLLDRLIGLLSGPWHSRAGWVAAVSAIAAALSAPFVFQRRGAAGGLRSVGFATLAGAAPGLVFAGAATYWFSRSASDDPFTSSISAILEDLFLVPRQNYLIIAVAGALFAASGYLIAFLAPRIRGTQYEEAQDEYGFTEYAYEDQPAWDGEIPGEELEYTEVEPAPRAPAGRSREPLRDDEPRA